MPLPTTAKVFAPAKVNLTLHVTGQRDDGYHLLDSLVVFVDVGDWIVARRARGPGLTVNGPFADAVPTGPENLIYSASKLFPEGPDVAIELTKNLPVSSGIGGGSTDAAATLRAMQEVLGDNKIGPGDVLRLGADVPVCLAATTTRMQGIGEKLTPVVIPPLHLVLINPGASVSTPQVFARLATKDNPTMPRVLPQWSGTVDFCAWVAEQRNDLQAPACALAPEIAPVLTALTDTPDCLLARMSGSGATCFGLYPTADAAKQAARDLRSKHQGWWVVSAGLWQPS